MDGDTDIFLALAYKVFWWLLARVVSSAKIQYTKLHTCNIATALLPSYQLLNPALTPCPAPYVLCVIHRTLHFLSSHSLSSISWENRPRCYEKKAHANRNECGVHLSAAVHA